MKEINKFDLNESTEYWVDYFNKNCKNKDLIFIFKNDDDAVYFSSFFYQKLCVLGGSEVVSICGKLVDNFDNFLTQMNTSLPCGFRMASRLECLYDILLNFETEPKYRTIIWNDAQSLFIKDSNDFNVIFEYLSLAAYNNRNGLSTLKEDGTPYSVNQRNIYLFVGLEKKLLLPYIMKEYEVNIEPMGDKFQKIKIDYEIIEI